MPQLSTKTKFTIAAGVGVVLLAGGLMVPVAMPEIVLPAEEIGNISGFPITNTLLATWLSMLVLIIGSWAATRNLKVIPSGLQNVMEGIVEATLSVAEGVTGSKQKARQFFPLVMTIFLFVLVSNWMGLMPGFSTIGVVEQGRLDSHFNTLDLGVLKLAFTPIGKSEASTNQATGEGEHSAIETSKEGKTETGAEGPTIVPLFRSANSGVNTTLALALIAMAFVEYFGLKSFGFTYVSKFLNVGKIFRGQVASGLLDLYVGILETISEIARVVSFTFRLFGNVFAGEVLLAVITFLVPWIAALPFMGLELFVGFIQAFVFAMLTLVFLTVATIHPHGEGAHEHHGH